MRCKRDSGYAHALLVIASDPPDGGERGNLFLSIFKEKITSSSALGGLLAMT